MDVGPNYRPLIYGEIIEDGDEWYTKSPYYGRNGSICTIGWILFYTNDGAVGKAWGVGKGWLPARRKIKLKHAVDVF